MKTLMIVLLTSLIPITISLAQGGAQDFTPMEFHAIRLHMMKLKSLNESKMNKIAWSIYKSSKNHNVDPEIMTSIIMTESSFRQDAVSSTGDISIVQINFEVWGKESKRLGFELSRELLKKDSHYAIDRMGVILSYLHSRYSKDPLWYGRYHSKTPSLKKLYSSRVQKHMKVALIETSSALD